MQQWATDLFQVQAKISIDRQTDRWIGAYKVQIYFCWVYEFTVSCTDTEALNL